MPTAFALRNPDHQAKLGLAGDLAPARSLVERHRPETMGEIVGQGETVFRLEQFLEAPYSTAFLFEGPSGTGKTTAALALARELGAVEYGGLEIIKSGMQDAEAVERVLRSLNFAPMLGSGWHVVIVDEADFMSPKAAQLWLSSLEDLPARSVVIFTTNHPEKFPERFRDRCERFAFDADPVVNLQDAQALVDRVWRAETGRDDSPRVADLRNVVEQGRLSYRRVVRALEPLLAARRASDRPAPAPEPRIAPETDQAPSQGSPDWAAITGRFNQGETLASISRALGLPYNQVVYRVMKTGLVDPSKLRRKKGR